jgi:hypothetical protein
MSAPLGRKLPHSIDAEMAFLGCQLLHPDKKLGNGLKHQHFVLDQHGYLFAAIREAQAAGTFFDFEHAKVWMANDDRFTIVGGVGYLDRLAGCATAVINAEEYAHLIFDLAGKRDLIAIAETLETSAHNAAVCETADVLRARIRKALNANECEFANNANGPRGIINAATVDPEHIRWVWKYRIPARAITWIAGKGGSMKGLMGAAIAACATTSRPWPDGAHPCPAGRVLWMEIGEDKPADTLVPRLQAAGADLSQIDIIRRVPSPSELKAYSLFIASPGQALMLPGKSGNSDEDVRETLLPWTEAAEQFDFALFGLLHLSKKADAVTIDRVLGSVAWVNMSRITHLMVTDKDDKTRSLFSLGKSNISPPDLSGWWVRSTQVGETEQHRALTWTRAEDGVDADDVMQPRQQQDEASGDLAWLIGFLRGKGDVWTHDIWPAAEEVGIGKWSLKKVVRRHGELFDVTPMGNRATWKLR